MYLEEGAAAVEVVEIGQYAAFGRTAIGGIGHVFDDPAQGFEGRGRGFGGQQQTAVKASQHSDDAQSQVGQVGSTQDRVFARKQLLHFRKFCSNQLQKKKTIKKK